MSPFTKLVQVVFIIFIHGSQLVPVTVGFNQISRIPVITVRRSLSMHIGHDHSHSHDHGPDPSVIIANLKNPGKLLKGRKGKIVLFASTLLLISTIVKRRISSLDMVAFAAVTLTLSVFDAGKSLVKNWISKVLRLKEGIVKHSTPLKRNYFFKNENLADRVTLLGVAINLVLSTVKFFGGIAFNSAVLVADAGHSLSDLLSDFITLWAVQIARLPADNDHPYGHGKFESVGSLFLSLTLIATSISVGSWSYDKMIKLLTASTPIHVAGASTATVSSVPFLGSSVKPLVSSMFSAVGACGKQVGSVLPIHGVHASGGVAAAASTVAIPTWPALVLAGLSIGSKEWLFQITRRVGESLNSQILIANAWHHRSDSFSSVLSLFSIAAAMFLPGLRAADPAAGILIAGMIGLTGTEVLMESVKQLTDSSDESLVQQIMESSKLLSVDGIKGIDNVRARRVGSGSLVDLTVLTDIKLSNSAAESIAERARWMILNSFPNVLDVMVKAQSEEKNVCPLLVQDQRTSVEVEQDVRTRVSLKLLDLGYDANGETAVKRVTVHYLSAALSVEVLISLDDSINMLKAKEIANEVQLEVLRDNEISHAEIQLYLTESEKPLKEFSK